MLKRSYLPIPLTLAWSWFVGSLIQAIAAGAIVGAIIKFQQYQP